MSTQSLEERTANVPPMHKPRRGRVRFTIFVLATGLPLFVLYAALEALSWTVGETRSMASIAAWQSQSPGRIWRGGDGRSYLTYKVARVRLLKPDVIMLGSSRAAAVTGKPFAPHSFYNAGLTAWTFRQYMRFLELVTTPDYAPQVLFFNLDYWMFSKGFGRAWEHRFYETPPAHRDGLKFILDALLENPLPIFRSLPNARTHKGLYAMLSYTGFSTEGAMPAAAPTDDLQRLAKDGIAVGTMPVMLGEDLDGLEREQFERFVQYAQSKNITLIGIQFPYFKTVLDGLNANPNNGIWRRFRSEETRAYFKGLGIIYFDFADVPQVRDAAKDFVDSLHPAASVVSALIREMVAHPDVTAALDRIHPHNP